MSLDAVKDWSTNATLNTTLGPSLTLDGTVMKPSDVDNAFREMMAQVAIQFGKVNFKGTNLASAATTNLANATGNFIDITGTTAITALGTVAAGQLFFLRFTGALTFTHNATSLILPGAANITTANGDVAAMLSVGAGNWVCAGYQRAGGGTIGVGSSTDNTVPRFDGAVGKLQTSGVVISDTNAVSGIVGLTVAGGGSLTGTWTDLGTVSTIDINGGTLDGTTIGGTSAGAITGTTITATGAFTSLGIDDNATGERLQIADTLITVGPATATGYPVERPVDTGYLELHGGTVVSGVDSTLFLYGGAHSTKASDYEHWANGAAVYAYDFSATKHIFSGVAAITGIARIGQNTTDAPGVGNNTTGACVGALSYFSNAGQVMAVNHTSSGNLVGFYLAGVSQGFISGAGATITYGAFMGSHIGQMYGSSANVELLRGSIVKTVDAMSEWLGFTYVDHDGVEHNKEQVPAGRKLGDVFPFTYDREIIERPVTIETVTEAVTEEFDEPYDDYEIVDGQAKLIKKTRKRIMPVYDEYPAVNANGKPIMMVKNRKRVQRTVKVARKVDRERRVEHDVKRVEPFTVAATVILLENDTLVRWELTNEAGCERPYGVIAWKESESSDDWLISSLGAYVCRIKAGVKVDGGDLVQSSDVLGCGEPMTEGMNLTPLQVAKRHVATVGASIPQQIYKGGPLYYPDGSYLVPCTIHCG